MTNWKTTEEIREDMRHNRVPWGKRWLSEDDVKKLFEDKLIEARLCSCDAIQNLKLKDANKISDKHKVDCIYIFLKRKYLNGGKDEQGMVREKVRDLVREKVRG